MHEVFSRIQEVSHICFVLEVGIKLQKIARLRKTYAFRPGLSHAGRLRPAGAERQGGGLRGQIEHTRSFRALSTLMTHIPPLWSYQSIGSIRIKVQDGSFSSKQSKTKENPSTQHPDRQRKHKSQAQHGAGTGGAACLLIYAQGSQGLDWQPNPGLSWRVRFRLLILPRVIILLSKSPLFIINLFILFCKFFPFEDWVLDSEV